MKVTLDNIKNLPISSREHNLLNSLLVDLDEINQKSKTELYIDWIDEHTECSPESTDPCPDYYGMYRIIPEAKTYVTIGLEMTLNDLDLVMCALYNYIVDL